MSTQTLQQRALQQRARIFAGAPAAAPAVGATILNQTAEVTAGFMLDRAEASVDYLGGPLGVSAGTNASDAVKLGTLGTLRVRRPGGGRLARAHLAYRNTGTFAAAGDAFAVAYGFGLTPTLGAGFVPLVSRIGWILTVALGDGTCAVRTGGVAAARSGATLEFDGSFDAARFAASTILGFDLLLDIFWTVPETAAALGATEGALNVNAPADSIELSLIAEPPVVGSMRREAGVPGIARRTRTR